MTDRELQEIPESRYRELFDQYFNYVYAIVFRILRNCGTDADVEECVSDTFADVMRRMQEIDAASIKAYLGTSAKNKALNLRRTLMTEQKRYLPLEDLSEMPAQDSVEDTAEASQIQQKLLNLIATLGEPDTSILLQKYYYNRNSGEIAAALGMTPAAVRKRCTRALKRLKQALAEEESL